MIETTKSIRIYYAALLRTHQGFIAPTQGPLLNYVQRVPLGVVAQITVSPVRVVEYYACLTLRYSRSIILSSLP